MSVKESTLEAVLERPMHDESGSVPPFDESEWNRQMQDSGSSDTALIPESGATLAEALGLPEDLADKWPGHCYKPPKLKQLHTIIPLVNKMEELFKGGDVLAAMDCAVEIVRFLARKEDGVTEVTADEIMETFDEDEITALINHMMQRQGLGVDDQGNAGGGRQIGLKTFQPSAASTTPTTLNGAESLPSPS